MGIFIPYQTANSYCRNDWDASPSPSGNSDLFYKQENEEEGVLWHSSAICALAGGVERAAHCWIRSGNSSLNQIIFKKLRKEASTIFNLYNPLPKRNKKKITLKVIQHWEKSVTEAHNLKYFNCQLIFPLSCLMHFSIKIWDISMNSIVCTVYFINVSIVPVYSASFPYC